MPGLISLWSATAAPGPVLPALGAATRADVAIVGAGYTGLSAALHLAASGRDCVVLEAADVGEGASGLNGGQVIPGVKYDPDDLERMFGERAARMIDTVTSGVDLVFDVIARHSIDCQAVRNGWLQPATSAAALALIEQRVRQWRARGADVELLSAAQTARAIGSQRYSGSWIDRRAGTVQPLAFARGLARAALAAGVRVFAHSPALSLRRSAGSWHIETPSGSVTSATVILATNAYTGRLVERLRRTVIPIPSFQVATEVLPASLREHILPGGQAASDTWHLLRYFRVDASGRLVMGSRGMFSNAPVSRIARHHYRAVREIFPQLEGIRYEYHWGGLVAMTRDHLPHLHELEPGLLAGLGYNGRGVAMATMMGRVLAQWVSGMPAQELGFPVTAVQPIPMHRFSRLGARAAIQGLRALDGLARLRARFGSRGRQ